MLIQNPYLICYLVISVLYQIYVLIKAFADLKKLKSQPGMSILLSIAQQNEHVQKIKKFAKHPIIIIFLGICIIALSPITFPVFLCISIRRFFAGKPKDNSAEAPMSIEDEERDLLNIAELAKKKSEIMQSEAPGDVSQKKFTPPSE